MQEYLMDGESVVSRSKRSNLVLTNVRIRYQTSTSTTSDITSIFLNKISSIEVHHKVYVLFLISGFLAIVAGVVFLNEPRGEELGILGLALGGILILVFFLTRRNVITIKSDGGTSIDFHTRGMKREAVLKFINQIETAKHNYHKQ